MHNKQSQSVKLINSLFGPSVDLYSFAVNFGCLLSPKLNYPILTSIQLEIKIFIHIQYLAIDVINLCTIAIILASQFLILLIIGAGGYIDITKNDCHIGEKIYIP